MDEPNSHRALTGGGGYPLYGTASNVSDSEHSWTAGLEHGRAVTFASRRVPRPDGLFDKVLTGEDVTTIVQRQLVTQPGDMWIGADEDKQCSRLLRASQTVATGDHDECLQSPVLTDQRAHFAAQPHVDIGGVLNPISQVSGHVLVEAPGANDQRDPCRMLGQEQRSLTGRVSST